MGNLENKLAERASGNGTVDKAQPAGIKSYMNSPAIKKRFEELLDKRAPQFMTSLVNLTNSDKLLATAEPMTIIQSAMVAATLDLPIDKNLGYAWIVPYKNTKAGRYEGQFQMGYKGYIQLALRTAQYKAINVIEVHEGELVEWNPLTEQLKLDFEQRSSDVVIGYAGYFELLNGFRKAVYWSKEDMERHAKKYSFAYSKGYSTPWKTDFDAMAKKTVIRNMLSKWGILSIQMQQAYTEDINEEKKTESPDVFEGIDITPADYEVEGAGETPEQPEDKDQAVLDI